MATSLITFNFNLETEDIYMTYAIKYEKKTKPDVNGLYRYIAAFVSKKPHTLTLDIDEAKTFSSKKGAEKFIEENCRKGDTSIYNISFNVVKLS